MDSMIIIIVFAILVYFLYISNNPTVVTIPYVLSEKKSEKKKKHKVCHEKCAQCDISLVQQEVTNVDQHNKMDVELEHNGPYGFKAKWKKVKNATHYKVKIHTVPIQEFTTILNEITMTNICPNNIIVEVIPIIDGSDAFICSSRASINMCDYKFGPAKYVWYKMFTHSIKTESDKSSKINTKHQMEHDCPPYPPRINKPKYIKISWNDFPVIPIECEVGYKIILNYSDGTIEPMIATPSDINNKYMIVQLDRKNIPESFVVRPFNSNCEFAGTTVMISRNH
jgi:hypothetical protein